MQVLFDKVAIISKGRSERQGGLYLAPSADEALVVAGEVTAAGPLAADFVKVGDIVHFNKHSAFPVKIGGIEYRILPVKEILVVEDKVIDTTPEDVFSTHSTLLDIHSSNR
jgi:co-chaperonin GroES (HSP10)